jgi:glyoxylase-like metal-dependent hydrolase (beta-lactamase superfamily II)
VGATAPAWVQDLGDGIYAVDTAFHREAFDAAYLLVQDGRAAFVDTGTNHAVPRLLALLSHLGVGRDAVDHVIPTHVHLDHAGGAGALMQALPGATLWVHPRGLPHLVDPARLYEGALAVYGQEEMDRSYGRLVPVAAGRVQATHDGMALALGSRTLRIAHTPGHARHHHCLWDERTRGWFTGDTFGLSYREFDTARGAWITPTTPPAQFDPQALRESVQALLAADPACMYLTHFGRVTDVPRLGRMFLGHLDRLLTIALRHQHAGPERHRRLKHDLLAMYTASLAAHGCRLSADARASVLAMDTDLNAKGLAIWLDRSAEAAPTSP